jgi:type VI secretion system protein ImpG
MRDELLVYYERELAFLRQMGAEFAAHYPKVAARLQLEPTRCEDPHVERMIEAFSLLAARIHLRLDDDFPEITQALLNIVYPHYTRPVPSMAVAEFSLRESKLTTSVRIPRESILYSRPVEALPCKFRTCYETDHHRPAGSSSQSARRVRRSARRVAMLAAGQIFRAGDEHSAVLPER